MVPFKDVFLGNDTSRGYSRATSAQKCLRVGGKHNDLDNIGMTARHHSFFEMLGNFSFGDYFKEEAIHLAWNYVTKELGLPHDRLRVTVHHSDKVSAEIWAKHGVKDVIPLGDEDNFWTMGDGPGPCGPCTEIFYDQRIPDSDGETWLEVWNLVFMEMERGPRGILEPLSSPCVDTGMGLERIASVLQGQPTNYHIDTIARLIEATAALAAERSQSVRDKDELLTPGVAPAPEAACLCHDLCYTLNSLEPRISSRFTCSHGRVEGCSRPSSCEFHHGW